MTIQEKELNFLIQREKFLKIITSELNRRQDLNKSLSIVLKIIQEFTGIEATAIRLQDNGDYTYYLHSGFPRSFIKKENSLISTDKNGNRLMHNNKKYVLKCMCGNIIEGRFDSYLSFFTQDGSFWANCTADLIASTSEKNQQTTARNYCNLCGYESVALIPIISDETCLGLLQLNDHRKKMFSLELIEYLENIGKQIGYSVQNNLEFNKLKEASEKIRLLNLKLKSQADEDPLTGLLNRRSFIKILKFEKNRSNRTMKPFTLIMADIDYFKKINDSYGHDAGDKVIVSVAKTLTKTLRKSDIVARWGGDEFLIFLPETSQEGGLDLADKLKDVFLKKIIKYSSQKISISLSFGVFECGNNKNYNECIKNVDSLLFMAKKNKR